MNSKKNDIVCPITMKILGDYWVIRIIDELGEGESRFCDLRRGIEGINSVTLSNRLKSLEELKLITRSEETIDKLSVTYNLTSLGRDALPFVENLKIFLKKVSKAFNG